MLSNRKLLVPAALAALLAAASMVMAGPGAALLDATVLPVKSPTEDAEADAVAPVAANDTSSGVEDAAPLSAASPDGDGAPDAHDRALLDATLRAYRGDLPAEKEVRDASLAIDVDVPTRVGNLTAKLHVEETYRAERRIVPAPEPCRDLPAPDRCCKPIPREDVRTCTIEQSVCVKATVKVGGVCVEIEYKCHLKVERRDFVPRAMERPLPRECERAPGDWREAPPVPER